MTGAAASTDQSTKPEGVAQTEGAVERLCEGYGCSVRGKSLIWQFDCGSSVQYRTDSRRSTGPEYAPMGSHICWTGAQNLVGQSAAILRMLTNISLRAS
jgi:hypothetical protein